MTSEPIPLSNPISDSGARTDWLMHGIFLSLSIFVIAASFLLKTDGKSSILLPGTKQRMPSLCSSRMVLGIECPGCGMTRSFIAISHGNFGLAWELNRSSFLVYALVWGQIPWHGFQLFRLGRGYPPIFWQPIYFIPILVAVAMIVNWVLKVAGW